MTVAYHEKDGFQETLLWSRKFPHYVLHRISVVMSNDKERRAVPMSVCLTEDGKYIGNPRFVNNIIRRFGIATFETNPDRCDPGKVCCIGWSPRRRKWFGWSHRAIFGFGIGTKLRANGLVMRLKKDRTIKTLAEAKHYARMFARAVS